MDWIFLATTLYGREWPRVTTQSFAENRTHFLKHANILDYDGAK